MSTKEAERKPDGEDNDEEDEEDLEQLQAEIARMEAEAARITKETEELENKKGAKLSSDSKSGGAAASTTGNGETPNRDGCVVASVRVPQCDNVPTNHCLIFISSYSATQFTWVKWIIQPNQRSCYPILKRVERSSG